ncbi:DUF502 domain-containing protein [Pararhodobacter aggregans]|uniref:DUF502 domain-containing protein n=1 Tax=Pararhodobacter aggregans TaxID=404875 RepID=A0A2T7UPU7_9RHOB|nr:DUF502 domain-containing protein [Pararhodobacter aggregans]PTX01271.1 putative membrane protein [Pararhodobacter aggregans]PVE46648.1 hypothetical protein DDE23_16010 [Pararhodobacter aggregans]
MSTPPRPHRRGFFAGLRASFLTGLVVVAPAVLTIWLITAVVEFVDSRVIPLIPRETLRRFLPENLAHMDLISLPGIGLVIALLFTLIVGFFAKGFIGRSLIQWGEDLVSRMPVVRSIYNALKQIAETVFAQSSTSFNRACLVQYPRPGLWAVAFVSTDTKGEIAQKIGGEKLISVFLPTTPNPTSGFLLFVPEKDVIALDMSIEDAAKLIISAGLVAPDPAKPGQVVRKKRDEIS